MKKLVIRNMTGFELGLMLEPSTEREDLKPGEMIVIEASFVDDELIIDVGDQNFISIWSPPDASLDVLPGGQD